MLGNYEPGQFANELDLALHYFRYWMEHSDILELLMQINRQDIIYACHMKNAELLRQRFGQLPGIDEQHGNYFIAVRTGFTISVLTAWLNTGRKERAEELVEIIREQLAVLTRSL